MMLEISPYVLGRIQLGRICRQTLNQDAVTHRAQIVVHELAAMRRQSIPNDQQPPGEMPQQMLQKDNDVLAPDRLLEDLEVESPKGDSCDDRQRLPVEVMLQDWRLAPGRPSATPMRSLAQSTFVDEYDRKALFLRFFLRAGQRFVFHSSMADSLRSIARPTGSCGLQFSLRKTFQT